MNDTATPVKRITRKKTSATPSVEPPIVSATPRNVKVVSELFTELISTIDEDKTSFDTLQKEILEIRESWTKEQARHETAVKERDQQEELERRREREAYEYELGKTRKQVQDEFAERKAKWEKELLERKEELEQDKKELVALRGQVAGFEKEIERAVKEVRDILSKELTEQFATEKRLSEQEVKAERELLELKNQNLTAESERQAREVEVLKKALEVATVQLKDIAVKVIESSGTTKPSIVSES